MTAIGTAAVSAPALSPGWTDAYSDRARPPASTVAALRPHFASLGITRVADQTGLDRIGIPCMASFRPNSQSLACSQGKGLDRDAATASAVMEAAELAIAESPRRQVRRASAQHLRIEGVPVFNPDRWLPFGSEFDVGREIGWLEGTDRKGGAIAVPIDLIRMGAEDPELSGAARSTNGLASGNTEAEARFHGTCELVERDAVTLWSLAGSGARQRAIAPARFGDSAVAGLVDQVEAAGLQLRLFDLTSDLGIPTVLAVIGGGPEAERRHFGLTAGYGCHPIAGRAAIRAITESAQSRITLIAGARDDIDPDDFGRSLDVSHAALLEAPPVADAPAGLPFGTPLDALHRHLLEQIDAFGIDLVAVQLGGEEYGIHVVRMLSQTLEDREPNCHWRPGPRALSVLLG